MQKNKYIFYSINQVHYLFLVSRARLPKPQPWESRIERVNLWAHCSTHSREEMRSLRHWFDPQPAGLSTRSKSNLNFLKENLIIQSLIRVFCRTTLWCQDYTHAGIIKPRFWSLDMRAFMGWKLIFDIIGPLNQLTSTRFSMLFPSYNLRVPHIWRLKKNGA